MVSIYYRTAKTKTLSELQKTRAGVWVHIEKPASDELEGLAEKFDITKDALTDAVDLYEAPRVEVEGGIIYIFTRYAYPANIDIATEPLMIAIKDDGVITVMRNETNVLDRLLDGRVPVVTTMKTKLLLQILAEVNRSFQTQLNAIGKNILSVRGSLNKADIDNDIFVSLIDIEENLNEFLSALVPQKSMLGNLAHGKVVKLFAEDEDMLEDLELGTAELIEIAKSRLKTISNTREAYSTIMANNLNRTFRRLTSISIFVAVPAVFAALYGMNLTLPLATHPYSFWIIVTINAVLVTLGIWIFQRKKWL